MNTSKKTLKERLTYILLSLLVFLLNLIYTLFLYFLISLIYIVFIFSL